MTNEYKKLAQYAHDMAIEFDPTDETMLRIESILTSLASIAEDEPKYLSLSVSESDGSGTVSYVPVRVADHYRNKAMQLAIQNASWRDAVHGTVGENERLRNELVGLNSRLEDRDLENKRLYKENEQLRQQLADEKERFNTRTIDFNNAYNANTAYAEKVRDLEQQLVEAQSIPDTIRRMVCGIGVVGSIDSHDVIRRNSVIDVIDAAIQGGKL